ncbi:MAG: transcriptional repressor NrdR [Nitriliruptoraceae bacterium]|nr:transcriptional repressor NrdR [Nitriliruptoraceae bacterium]
MRCPGCGADDDRVVDSRPASAGDAIRRRRECRACGLRFTTFERIELPELLVRKRSGIVRAFSRQKVLDGMAGAAKGRIPMEALEAAAAAVERLIRDEHEHEVSSEQVGLQVLAQLRELDPVVYVRFASVYRDFQGPEDFEQELSRLAKSPVPRRLAKDAPPKRPPGDAA